MNFNDEHWIQPDGIDGILPDQARVVESLRRALLDLYAVWGYDLVIPPFLDFLPSLLSGSGKGLDQQTFKFVDPYTGKMVGIRADMTPQVARMDAHELGKDCPVRLCYFGTVLHTKPDGFGAARSLLQLGVELYGRQGVDSDIEVLELMLKTLAVAGIDKPHIDLGHVGVFRGLARCAGLNDEQEQTLYDALQRKAVIEIAQLVKAFGLHQNQGRWFEKLVELNGSEEVLVDAERYFATIDTSVVTAIGHLQAMAKRIKSRMPGFPLYFDLAELRGYQYHTGVVFAAFAPGYGQEIARGGRYDEIGSVFGRARPATGFSTDLKTLVTLGQRPILQPVDAIYALEGSQDGLDAFVAELRQQGKRVIRGDDDNWTTIKAMGCQHTIDRRNAQWVVRPLVDAEK